MTGTLLAVLLALGAIGTPASIEKGRANFAEPSHGIDYLALREKRGTLVEICGAGGCLRMVSTDYGPDKDTGDLADIALVRFAAVCGWSVSVARRMGECDVTIEKLRVPHAPATDVAP
jgi:hypothetical protein